MDVLYTGTFDPLTNGHLNIIERASKLFDKVYVLVNTNSSKTSLFEPYERFAMVSESLQSNSKIIMLDPPHCEAWSMTTPDFMQKYHVDALIRGIRNGKDAEYEHELYLQYKRLFPGIEEFVMFADKEHLDFSSTFVRESIRYKKWQAVKECVPPAAFEIIRKKFNIGN